MTSDPFALKVHAKPSEKRGHRNANGAHYESRMNGRWDRFRSVRELKEPLDATFFSVQCVVSSDRAEAFELALLNEACNRLANASANIWWP